MIIETWKRYGTRPLPDWCAGHEQEVKPPLKKFLCERKPELVAKKLEEVFTAAEISEIVALLTLKY